MDIADCHSSWQTSYGVPVRGATDNRSRYDYQNIFGSSIRHSAFVVKTGTGTWRANVISWNVVGTVVLTSRHESQRNERTTKLEKYLMLIVLRASREIQQGEEIFFLKHRNREHRTSLTVLRVVAI